ncbi:MAG: hypothetical protein MR850_06660 [Bacteroidales bacterium]|nr:hypothetical protein [Bacteroidales bacterium]
MSQLSNTKCFLLVAVYAFALPLRAQVNATDSLSVKLDQVVVEADQQNISASVSTYFPTSKQKNASQSGIDLLNRMAIPQLALGAGTKISTVSNKSVATFIDWLPATTDDLRNMRAADVKKVEYYDYPSDPRFLGNAHVVNFVMKRYEYGGYLKVLGSERFIANDGQLNLFGKFQSKKFTFDLGLGASYSKSTHDFTESFETYRLPQNDGSEKTFRRTESVGAADKHGRLLWPTLKVVYNTDKITISNVVGASFDHTPTNNTMGTVSINSEKIDLTDFCKTEAIRQNSLSYSGNWNFILGKDNTINFNPVYSYTHSRQSSLYREGTAEFPNYAEDDSHSLRARLQFNHSFGNYGNLKIFCQGMFYSSSTRYSGTTDMHDRLNTYRIGPGLGYSFSRNKYYIYLGVGENYVYSKYGQTVEHSAKPWADASVQYSLNGKNHISAEFHYMTSVPLSSYRSEAVVRSNPLMSYTGNPALKPYKSFDYGITYTCIPNKRFSFSVYATGWSVLDRYAFVYTPSPTGILRKIEQPMGGFTSLTAGVYGRVILLQNRLQIAGLIAMPFCHNGEPFNTDHVDVNYSLQAYWYFGAWNIGAQYFSDKSAPGSEINGLWTKQNETYYLSMGWGNSTWNVLAQIANPFTWSRKNSSSEMSSRYFDRKQFVYGVDRHCYIKLGATYVFGFGKHVKQRNEASRQSGAGSAILE